MSEREVTTAIKGDPRPPITTYYDFGDNLEEAVEKFGEEAVFSRYLSAGTVDLQGYIRGMMKKMTGEGDDAAYENSDEEIVAAVKDYVLGVKKAAKTPKEKAMELLQSMELGDIEEIYNQLKAEG